MQVSKRITVDGITGNGLLSLSGEVYLAEVWSVKIVRRRSRWFGTWKRVGPGTGCCVSGS